MRTFLIALAGFAVVGGIGLTTFALLPTADGGPLHPIQVNSPERIEPITPVEQVPAQTRPTPAAPPAQTPQRTPVPTDPVGVPEPPPAIWRDDSRGDDGWDDDGWSGENWSDDGDDGWDDDGDDDDGGDDD